jgi:hypothetical protein
MSAAILPKKPLSDAERAFIESILPKVELIADDGEPMESEWQLRETALLIDSVDHQYKGREDYYVGGNMFVYFSEKQADRTSADLTSFRQNTRRFPIPSTGTWLEDGSRLTRLSTISKTTRDLDYGEKSRSIRTS